MVLKLIFVTMKKILLITVITFLYVILEGFPAFFAFLISGMFLIYGTLALLMWKYFTIPDTEPTKKPLPLRIING